MKKNYRCKKIIDMVPLDVKTALDIGSLGNIFNKKYKTISLLNIKRIILKRIWKK